MKCISLRHFGQEGGVGGGRFSAMTLTLASGASVTDLTVADDTGDGTAIAKVYNRLLLSVCTVPDSGPQESGGLGAFPYRNGGMT